MSKTTTQTIQTPILQMEKYMTQISTLDRQNLKYKKKKKKPFLMPSNQRTTI